MAKPRNYRAEYEARVARTRAARTSNASTSGVVSGERRYLRAALTRAARSSLAVTVTAWAPKAGKWVTLTPRSVEAAGSTKEGATGAGRAGRFGRGKAPSVTTSGTGQFYGPTLRRLVEAFDMYGPELWSDAADIEAEGSA